MSDGIVIALITAGGALLLGLLNLGHNWGQNSKKERRLKSFQEESKHKELMARLVNIEGQLDTSAKGLQAILRFELYSIWGCCETKGYACGVDRENFLNLYEKYHNMGSNGVMDHIKDSLLELPLKMKPTPRKRTNKIEVEVKNLKGENQNE